MKKRYYSYNQWTPDEMIPTDGFQVRYEISDSWYREEYPSAKELILKLIHEYPNYENLVYATRINLDFDNVENVMSSIYVHSTINRRLCHQLSDQTYKILNYNQIVKLINDGNVVN